MVAIERTAYPRFKRAPTAKELAEVYSLTDDERRFVQATARSDRLRLSLAVLLKAFGRLGYFPSLADVPAVIVGHLRGSLGLPAEVRPGYDEMRTLYRHHQAIRTFLEVRPYGPAALHVAVTAVHRAATVKDHAADLLNIAIEELVRQRYELPAFSTLDRLVGHIRAQVNRRLFHQVLSHLTDQEQRRLDELLVADHVQRRSLLGELKAPPKSATLQHLQELQNRLVWLLSLGEVERPLSGLAPAKIAHFAAEARVLDADGLQDMAPPKRYTLLLCLIHHGRVALRDALVDTFLKCLARIHTKGKEALARLHEQQRAVVEELIGVLAEVLDQAADDEQDDARLGGQVRSVLSSHGGAGPLRDACALIAAAGGNNYLPLLWRFYQSHRQALVRLARALELHPTTQDRSVLDALEIVLDHERSRREWLPITLDLSFASEQWRRTVLAERDGQLGVLRRHLEVCVFSSLASELRTGDVFVVGSEGYADYREQLLPWARCEPQVAAYCQELGFPETARGFVERLQHWLTRAAEEVDRAYPENGQLVISDKGEPVLKRPPRQPPVTAVASLEAAVAQRLPERSVLDVLANVEHWLHWTRHFGPLSGTEPKLDDPVLRYILTTFGYGCNLGPWQTARHTRGLVTPHQISHANRRHVTATGLDAALRDVINRYHRCGLPRLWGTGKTAAADGTKFDLYEENLLAEYSIRYGGYGGIAYHHVSDTYIALFSHFIACGVWEAVYILDGLLKNTSDIQPDVLHADTQGQSTAVFGLAHLLGIQLMPRIRNWKDLVFYRPGKDVRYKHIDALFGEAIDWDLIETHWADLLRVVLSIKAGTVLPSTLLRKLGSYSRKNRLYQAFRELGRVVRTVFLLRYISDRPLREQITATTNKVEAYNGFTKWLSFGGDGVIPVNDPDEQEKRIKYTDLVANALILQNVVDTTQILRDLASEGYTLSREAVAALSPYLTRHIKRFGDYVLDLSIRPDPLDEEMAVPLPAETD